MESRRVELLFFPGCPHIEAARAALRLALGANGVWHEINVVAPGAPQHLRGSGSPTILVDGKDVASSPPSGSEAACRVYPREDGTPIGAPPLSLILAALNRDGTSA